MYVCICNAVTDSQIKMAVREGYSTFEKIQQHLDVATCCGQCKPHAKEVIQAARDDDKESTTGEPIRFYPASGLASI